MSWVELIGLDKINGLFVFIAFLLVLAICILATLRGWYLK
jgi:hypothetical protein